MGDDNPCLRSLAEWEQCFCRMDLGRMRDASVLLLIEGYCSPLEPGVRKFPCLLRHIFLEYNFDHTELGKVVETGHGLNVIDCCS